MAEKQSESNLQEEIDSLKADLANLRSDFSDIAGALRDLGVSKAESWRDYAEEELNERREEIRRALGEARARGRRTEEDIERRISENPWSSLLAALGVGFILAKIMDRGERR